MSGHLGGVLRGPECIAKIDRVLDAARAWRKRFADLESFDVSKDLKDAVDALDAPVERYAVDGVIFKDKGLEVEQTVRDTLAGTHFTVRALPGAAEKIAAALNAAERGKA